MKMVLCSGRVVLFVGVLFRVAIKEVSTQDGVRKIATGQGFHELALKVSLSGTEYRLYQIEYEQNFSTCFNSNTSDVRSLISDRGEWSGGPHHVTVFFYIFFLYLNSTPRRTASRAKNRSIC